MASMYLVVYLSKARNLCHVHHHIYSTAPHARLKTCLQISRGKLSGRRDGGGLSERPLSLKMHFLVPEAGISSRPESLVAAITASPLTTTSCCRVPKRCWYCKGSGHIAISCRAKRAHSSCPQKIQTPSKQKPTPAPPALRSSPKSVMARHISVGNASTHRDREIQPEMEARGSAFNFPGNPRFRPRVAFKTALTSADMEERKRLLTNYALLVKEEGPLGLHSCDEVL
jgi:hypothetical protein